MLWKASFNIPANSRTNQWSLNVYLYALCTNYVNSVSGAKFADDHHVHELA